MELAQKMSSMILGLRRKVNIKVSAAPAEDHGPRARQGISSAAGSGEALILNEVNVKELEFLKDTSGILVKKIKPNFKLLGPRYGKLMKEIAQAVNGLRQEDIACFEANGSFDITVDGETIVFSPMMWRSPRRIFPDGWWPRRQADSSPRREHYPGTEGRGIAREFVNRIQNLGRTAALR